MLLRHKIFLSFFLTAFLPFLAIGPLIFLDFRSMLKERAVAQLSAVADAQKARIEGSLASHLEEAEMIASSAPLRMALKLENGRPDKRNQALLGALIADFKDLSPRIESIDVLDAHGRVAASTEAEIFGMDLSESAAFEKGRTKPSFLKPFDLQGRLGVKVVAPIVLEEEFQGVLVLKVEVESVTEDFAIIESFGRTVETVLAARHVDGAMIIAPTRLDPEAAFRQVIPVGPTARGIIDFEGPETVLKDAIDYRGERVIAAMRLIKAADWALVVKMDEAEALIGDRSLTNQIFYLVLLLLMVTFFMTKFLAASISDPLAELAEAAEATRRGDFLARVAIRSNDEIGRLAASFNVMAKELKDYHGSLDNQIRDRDAVLSTSRARKDAVLEAVSEAVYVLDEAGKFLYANGEGLRELGMQPDAALGRSLAKDLLRAVRQDGTDLPATEHVVTLALAKLMKVRGVSRYRRPDGTYFRARTSASPVMQDGKLIGAVAAFREEA